jgi:transposase InsO family protein
MHKELLARGIRVVKDRVRKLMKQHGIKARTKRKFVVTTDSKYSLPVALDLGALLPPPPTVSSYAARHTQAARIAACAKNAASQPDPRAHSQPPTQALPLVRATERQEQTPCT